LVGWHAGVLGFPLSDVILAQLACPLTDIMFYLHSGRTNLSLYKDWYPQSRLEKHSKKQFGKLASKAKCIHLFLPEQIWHFHGSAK
jgi:hypothetical protein